MAAIRWSMVHRRLALLGAGLFALAAVVLTLKFASDAGPASANPATGFVAISTNENFTCGLTAVGGVKCWGDNFYGELGIGTSDTNPHPIPADVVGLTSGVAAVAVGNVHACAVTTAGGLKCWGSNGAGQLGEGTTIGPDTCSSPYNLACSTTPVDASGLTSGATGISAGEVDTCAVTTGGGAKCWGNNDFGQLGNGTTTRTGCHCISTPVDVSGLASGIAAVGVGRWHSCALTAVGGVKCWGNNLGGQVGNGTTSTTGCYCISTPVDVSGLTSGAGAIGIGHSHTCAVTLAGGLKCWAANVSGQLGDGTFAERTAPVDVVGLSSGVTAVDGGADDTCAVISDGAAKCWGSNYSGELGNGTTTPSATPVDVVGLSGAVGIAAGGYDSSTANHTCAITSGTGARCWGTNYIGQLGDGSTTQRTTPVDVVDVYKGPTFTPTNTPTPGPPTPTPLPCPPGCGLDFSIGTDLLSGAGGTCDSSGSPTAVCDVPLGGKFNVSVYLNSLPAAIGGGGYGGYDATLQYSGLTATQTKQSLHLSDWPGCGLPGPNFLPGTLVIACALGIGQPASLYTGRMAAPEFTCTADGVITLLHGNGNTSIVDNNLSEFSETADESLTVHCVPPAAYPADTDSDGCPDAREAGMNQMMGGRRNFLNPWDWWDHLARIDDVLAVASHYGKNAGDPGYDTKYDRTYIGPNAWNLGPPNGQIRIDDVLGMLHQYGAGCSAS